MLILNKIQDIRKQVARWKQDGYTVGFVPTMGALHIGHASLIEKAKKTTDKVIVSIFVNPTQFGPKEDYNCYPRTLELDSQFCEQYGVDMIFIPSVDEIYMKQKCLTDIIPPVDFTDKLCGKSRQGHFNGVALIVIKLFNIVQPNKAFFGQKDAQQLAVIKKICLDLNIPVEIVTCPIKRDKDGLACSSRNSYLSENARTKALSLYKVIKKVEELYYSGEKDKSKVLENALGVLDPDFELDYIQIVDSETMELLKDLQDKALVAIAAKIDGVRLIDNLVIAKQVL